MADDIDKGRRQFFKQSVWSMGKAVHEYYEQQKETAAPAQPEAEVKHRTDWLRPPGAEMWRLYPGMPVWEYQERSGQRVSDSLCQ